MVTSMVVATVSGLAADIERRWMEQLLQNTAVVPARASSEISGFYGLTQKAEQEWLSMLAQGLSRTGLKTGPSFMQERDALRRLARASLSCRK